MAKERQIDPDELRSSILDAIRTSIGELGSVASRLEDDATDLYSKNTPGDGYSKNTQIVLPERSFDPAVLYERGKRE